MHALITRSMNKSEEENHRSIGIEFHKIVTHEHRPLKMLNNTSKQSPGNGIITEGFVSTPRRY